MAESETASGRTAPTPPAAWPNGRFPSLDERHRPFRRAYPGYGLALVPRGFAGKSRVMRARKRPMFARKEPEIRILKPF